MAIDWIIPLGTASKAGNDELRLLLRSITRNARGLGRVVVVTDQPPEWLAGVEVVDCGDRYDHNKDGNMIDKVKAALDQLDITGQFVLSCDDTLLMQPLELEKMPIVYNPRGESAFWPGKDGKWPRWHRRILRTFWLAEELGCPLPWNLEAHVPQLYEAAPIREQLPGIRYQQGIGYTIFTLFRLLSGGTGEARPQAAVKTTWEAKGAGYAAPDKLFAGYNDAAFLNGLREWLFALFPEPCQYEKET